MESIKTIEMVRSIRDKQYKITKGMSHKEIISYFHRKAEIVNKRSSDIVRQQPPKIENKKHITIE